MANGIENLKHNFKRQLEQSALYISTKSWYEQLAERDQKIVKAISVIVVAALLFSWVWQPVMQGRAEAESRYVKELKFHNKMKENAYLFSQASSGASTGTGGSILSTVNNTAKVKNIQLKRFEPDGDSGLRIWLDKVNFDAAIAWLELLETTRGITVEQISIDKVEPGIVNIRAVLQS